MASVIIVDDDLDVRTVFSEYLSLKGFDVLGTGNNGREAAILFEKLRPDIVLMDVMMPEYSGVYGLKTIREIDHDAKVIMVTADTSKNTRQKLEEIGSSAILYKPYDVDDVTSAINDAVSEDKIYV